MTIPIIDSNGVVGIDRVREVKHVVMFSTGASSACLLHEVIEKYGKENTIPFFTDTLWEDEDNYRFMDEVLSYLDIKPVVYTDGRTPEETFFDDRFFGNYGTAPCSRELKMKQTVIYVEELRLGGYEPILYFGIGYHERERAERITKNYSHNCLEPVECRFPFTDKPMSKGHFSAVIEGQWGIKLPRMYLYGFEHANCSGRCVKAGIKHYKLLYRVWPERFRDQEEMERRFRTEINDYTLLKKSTGKKDEEGKTIYESYSLTQLREAIEKNKVIQMDLFIDNREETPCACVV